MARQSADGDMLVTMAEVNADDIVSADPQLTVDHSPEADLHTLPNPSTAETTEQTNTTDADESFRPYEAAQFDEIIAFLEGEENLDIYQLTAFRVRLGAGCCSLQRGTTGEVIHVPVSDDDDDDNHADKHNCHHEEEEEGDEVDVRYCGYWMDIFKAVVCAFTQFSSIVVLYLQLDELEAAAMEELGKESWCDPTTQWKPKLMAVSYSFFLSLILYLNYSNQKVGFYRFVSYQEYEHSFISSNWLHIGRLVNAVLVLNVFYVSFFIVFFSTDPLDIILNCVALLFLVDIDNMVIDSQDYQKTLKWFKNADNIKRVKHTLMKRWLWGFWMFVRILVNLIYYITLLGIVAVPIIIAVCY